MFSFKILKFSIRYVLGDQLHLKVLANVLFTTGKTMQKSIWKDCRISCFKQQKVMQHVSTNSRKSIFTKIYLSI